MCKYFPDYKFYMDPLTGRKKYWNIGDSSFGEGQAIQATLAWNENTIFTFVIDDLPDNLVVAKAEDYYCLQVVETVLKTGKNFFSVIF